MINLSSEFWQSFKSTTGAMSCAEALALHNIAAAAPDGIYLELGTHKGKSTQAIAAALSERGCVFALVEPEFKDHKWEQSVVEKISPMVPKCALITWPGYSLDVIPQYEKLAFVFVDSGVHDDMVMQEVKALEDKVIEGGIIAFHDKGSQFTAVDRAYEYLVGTGKYEEIRINWDEIFAHVKENDLETGNDSWHQYPELSHPPNFIGALRRV